MNSRIAAQRLKDVTTRKLERLTAPRPTAPRPGVGIAAGLIAALLLVLLVLTGCGEGAGGQYLHDITVKRPSGGTVECVSQEHGLDCNWDGAR